MSVSKIVTGCLNCGQPHLGTSPACGWCGHDPFSGLEIVKEEPMSWADNWLLSQGVIPASKAEKEEKLRRFLSR